MNGLRPYVLPLSDRRLLSSKACPVPCSFIVTLTSSSIGPLVSLVMFLHMGSTQWRAVDCRAVLLAGLALSAPALALMCAFNDDKALLDHERHRQGRQATGRGQQAAEAAGAAGGLRPATAATAAGEGAAASLLNGQDTAEAGQAGAAASCQANGGEQLELLQSPLQQQQQQQAFRKRGWHPGVVITVLIGFSDLVGALASGGGCSSTLETPPPPLWLLPACRFCVLLHFLADNAPPSALSSAFLLSLLPAHMLPWCVSLACVPFVLAMLTRRLFQPAPVCFSQA